MAAAALARLERVTLHDWQPVSRKADARLAFQFSDDPDTILSFGEPGDNISGAIHKLNRQLSPVIFKRLNDDLTFRDCVFQVIAQTLLDGDVDLAKGLMRRMADATVGLASLSPFVDAHPKSVCRMMSRTGNPSARHLTAILRRLAQAHRVRFDVMTRPVRRS